ncbi:MAG: NAD-dependent succinate-semialdehyde dehydrogenase [Acidobacteriota bacterium]
MTIATVNPATGETVRTFDPLDSGQVEARIAAAVRGFHVNRARSFEARTVRMEKAAELLETRSADLGRMITIEMGKPVKAAAAEVVKCATACRYYAQNAKTHLADESIETDAQASFVRYEPLGPILAVMPWNFPFWQVFRFAAPALMAGNTCLLKHSSNVPQSALAIEQIFVDAGFVDHEFQTLLIGSGDVARVLEDDRVQAATLTGSEAAGASVAAIAGKQIKKVVLELGGSDPFIVLPSANLAEAVKTAVKARIVNNGQSCIAAKRFIVHDAVYNEFEKAFVEEMGKLRIGDPLDEATDVGPLAMPQLVDDIERQVNESVKAGAELLLGGKRIGKLGNFYEPTVLAAIPRTAPAYAEETFGPVASLFRVASIDEAIRIANDTSFGLGASVWTNDRREVNQLTDQLESGQVFVNAMVASDARVPFGGVKRSGFGRELGSFGIREFVNIKTVWIGSMKSGASDGSATE